MDMDRLKLLEQKINVMQTEINEVLGEVQMAMQGLARGNKMALDVIMLRIEELEKATSNAPVRTNDDGKEL